MYPLCSQLMLYDLRRLSIVSHYSLFYTDMSAFLPLLITGHGSHNLTPITPTTHHPGKELRKDLIYFYTHVYIAEMEAFAKQFEPLPGVSRCVQNAGWNHFDFALWIFWLVCHSQVETPPLSPYPLHRKGHKKRLSSSQSIYLSPYNAGTQPPLLLLGSYIFKEYPRKVCENLSLKEIGNILKRCTQQDEANEDEAPFKIPRMKNETFLQQRARNVMIDRMAEMDQNWERVPNPKPQRSGLPSLSVAVVSGDGGGKCGFDGVWEFLRVKFFFSVQAKWVSFSPALWTSSLLAATFKWSTRAALRGHSASGHLRSRCATICVYLKAFHLKKVIFNPWQIFF